MQRLVNAGLMEGPGYDPENEVWSQGAAFFPAAVPRFNAEESAFTVIQRWQFASVSAEVEFGLIPYPWGSNVEWPESEDWRDLAEEGYTSFMNDANMFTVIQGSPGNLTHEIAAGIAHSYRSGPTQQGIRAIDAMIAFAEGEPNPIAAPNTAQLFEEIDMELWQWYADNAVLEISGRMSIPGTFWASVMAALGTNTDVRSSLESLIGQDIWNMVDTGRIKVEDIPEDMWKLAEEYNASLPVEEE